MLPGMAPMRKRGKEPPGYCIALRFLLDVVGHSKALEIRSQFLQ